MLYHNTLDAVTYYKTSAESYALYIQTFALARWRLLFEYERRVAAGEDPGRFYIISDLDETLLDNSAYNIWLMETGRDFHRETWSAWCQARQAVGTPGARAFLDFVKSIGVKVFYVSSRYNDDREATAETLRRSDADPELGFPIADATKDPAKTFLFLEDMELEAKGLKTKKAEQFAYIRDKRQAGTTPLLQLGDNLSDHSPEKYNGKLRYSERTTNAKGDRLRWGADWIAFPNPIYGNWRLSLRYSRDGVERAAADEEPPKPYQSLPVRDPVSPEEAPKMSLLSRWGAA